MGVGWGWPRGDVERIKVGKCMARQVKDDCNNPQKSLQNYERPPEANCQEL